MVKVKKLRIDFIDGWNSFDKKLLNEIVSETRLWFFHLSLFVFYSQATNHPTHCDAKLARIAIYLPVGLFKLSLTLLT
jgi:hypothetical protein